MDWTLSWLVDISSVPIPEAMQLMPLTRVGTSIVEYGYGLDVELIGLYFERIYLQ